MARDASARGRAARNKGKQGEREIINSLQPIVDDVYGAAGLKVPTLQRNHMQVDEGGYDIVGVPWIAMEVKRCETLHVEKWWEQCVRQAGATHVPVLLYRRNGERTWRVRMYGYLGERALGHRVVVTVDMFDFMQWFRIQLCRELGLTWGETQ